MPTSPTYSLHLHTHQTPRSLTVATQPGSTWHGGSPLRKKAEKPGVDFLPWGPCVVLPTSSHSSTGCRALTELLFPRIPLPCTPTAQLHSPSSHAHYAQIRLSRLLTIFVAFCWTLSSWAISCWKFSALNWAEQPHWGLTLAEKKTHSICVVGCNLVHISHHGDDLTPLTHALPLILYDLQTLLCRVMPTQVFFFMQLLVSAEGGSSPLSLEQNHIQFFSNYFSSLTRPFVKLKLCLPNLQPIPACCGLHS